MGFAGRIEPKKKGEDLVREGGKTFLGRKGDLSIGVLAKLRPQKRRPRGQNERIHRRREDPAV